MSKLISIGGPDSNKAQSGQNNQNNDGANNSGKRKFTLEKEDVLKFMALMMLFGVILIFLYAIKKVDGGKSFSLERILDVLRTSSIGIIIGGASLMIGAFMGFLFGIPKALQSNAIAANAQSIPPPVSTANASGTGSPVAVGGQQGGQNAPAAPNAPAPVASTAGARTGFQHNDNLVEISDWLTKIIVGVGLTQMSAIPGKLNELGVALGVSFGADPPGQVFSVATVLFFLTDGFLLSYLWTRLYFIKLLNDVEGELEKALDTKEKLTQTKEELKDTRDALVVTGLAPNYKQKFVDKNDPQKGQWGGQAQVNNYRLEGIVEPIGSSTNESSLFKITLKVLSITPTSPLIGHVTFHLHPTFTDNVRIVPVVEGVALLTLVAYGAFTVGAVTSDNIQLELDLSQLPGAPREFKLR